MKRRVKTEYKKISFALVVQHLFSPIFRDILSPFTWASHWKAAVAAGIRWKRKRIFISTVYVQTNILFRGFNLKLWDKNEREASMTKLILVLIYSSPFFGTFPYYKTVFTPSLTWNMTWKPTLLHLEGGWVVSICPHCAGLDDVDCNCDIWVVVCAVHIVHCILQGVIVNNYCSSVKTRISWWRLILLQKGNFHFSSPNLISHWIETTMLQQKKKWPEKLRRYASTKGNLKKYLYPYISNSTLSL